MTLLTEDEYSGLMEYLKKDIGSCLYMYCDLVKYGINDPNIHVWYSKIYGEFNCVIMQYFKGAHIYSFNNDYNLEEVVDHFNLIDVDRICGNGIIIRKIQPLMGNRFYAEYGRTLKLSKYKRFKHNIDIETATIYDVCGITELLMSHKLYSDSYSYDQLYKELEDRISRNIGRSFIIKDGDRVVAHDSYNVETENVAVGGLALVHDDYRRTFYGIYLESYMINTMVDEGKTLYAMLFDRRRVEGFVKMGNINIGEYGKMMVFK